MIEYSCFFFPNVDVLLATIFHGFFSILPTSSFFSTVGNPSFSSPVEIRGYPHWISFSSEKPKKVSGAKRRYLEGRFLPQVMARIQSHEFVIDEDRCFGCGACVALCPVQVLTLTDRMIYVDEKNCTHCRLCLPSCPVFALDIVPER